MKARLVSTEELTLSINLLFSKLNHKAPTNWWDRSCDIALLLGTFIHGIGNYEAMLNDETLPFVSKIGRYATSDIMCCDAQKRFTKATFAAKKVCDDALEASKLKAQKEVQKAVAAAAAAALKREKEAAALREGGVAADAVISTMGEQPMDHLYEIQEGKDDHFITLPRLKRSIESSIRLNSFSPSLSFEGNTNGASISSSQKEVKGVEESKGRRKRNLVHTLPMPDARVLDFRLQILVAEIERYSSTPSNNALPIEFLTPKSWPASNIVLLNQRMREFSARFALASNFEQTSDQTIEYAGIGVNGSQCAVTHRTVDDRSDYSIGAASPDLYQVAHGPESPRYLRAIGVPMTFGRFGLVALVHADANCLNNMLENERKRFYSNGKKVSSPNEENDIDKQTGVLSKTTNPPTGEQQQESPEENGQAYSSNIKKEAMPASNDILNNGIPTLFQENATLRAGVASILLYFGYPFIGHSESPLYCDVSKINKIHSTIQLDENSPNRLFGAARFESLLQDLCGDTKIPNIDVIKEYIDRCFLPHCLKLCLYGNNANTQITRGSKGEYETSHGTSSYPEPIEKLQSPLPDPCLPLFEQSIEAVGMASAIIRRVKLMRCILKISSGQIQTNCLKDILHSRTMRKSMDGLPIWWCPWIHDTALLINASTRGLFSILKDLEAESDREEFFVFSREAIKQHIKRTFFTDETIPRLIKDTSSVDDTDSWIENYTNEFPSLNVIERRLAFLCAKATEDVEGGYHFDNLPMYDHGGWPRN